MSKTKRVRIYKLKNPPKAFQFLGSKSIDLLEKYILKGRDYSFIIRENKAIFNFADLTIKENDYIIIKKEDFEVMGQDEFEDLYMHQNEKKGE